jgi:hypothetical protein
MDASLSITRGADAALNSIVFVQGQNPGVCHVELIFATGFTYSAVVTFASKAGAMCGDCACADYLAPTSGPFTSTIRATLAAIPDAGNAEATSGEAGNASAE